MESIFTKEDELKPQYQPRNYLVGVRVSKHMKEQIKARSTQKNMSMSEYINTLLSQEVHG